ILVSAKKSAGEKSPEGPRRRRIARKYGRTNLPQADLTAGNVGRISSPRHSEKSAHGWLAGGPGFEPRLTGSEPVVLPLNYPPSGPGAGFNDAGRCWQAGSPRTVSSVTIAATT